VDPAEFIGVGFEIEPVANEWRVATVYPGTDAEAEGLQVGEVVLSLDGTTVTGLAADQIDSLLAGFELGEDLPVGIERGGEMTEVLVRVEDLLPDFDSP
jgi:S1-C subfamily serine protease